MPPKKKRATGNIVHTALLVAYTRLYKLLCRSVGPSVGLSVTFYCFQLKGDLTSVTAPAQRTRLMLSCIRPCLLLCSFLDMRLYDCSFRTLFVIPCKHAWILIVYTRLYKSFRPSVGPSVGRSSAPAHRTRPNVSQSLARWTEARGGKKRKSFSSSPGFFLVG